MYYRNYEDYMRSVLGYPIDDYNTYDDEYYKRNEVNKTNLSNQDIKELEGMYPDIYKKLNPLVEEICSIYSKRNDVITNNKLEEIVDEVYNKSNSDIPKTNYNRDNVLNTEKLRKGEKREQEIRQRKPVDMALRDLIKILILNKLINNKYERPNFVNYPPRPPVIPRPQPRSEFNDYLRF